MYLGVDGGGTKTAFVLLDKDGVILARRFEATSNYLEIGMDGLRGILTSGVQNVLTDAGVGSTAVDFAFFGLPSYGEDSSFQNVLDAVPSGLIPENRYVCDNDMVCGWAGSLACRDGINIVAGTGAIGYGQRQGRIARCSGWGELFGDEGSGYWIAQQGLALFSRMSDGRAQAGPLLHLFRERLELKQDLDLVTLVIEKWQGARSKIAGLCPLVFEAAATGDHLAMNILEQAANELALVASTIAEQLPFSDDERIAVSYSGGIFQTGQAFQRLFKSALNTYRRPFDLQAPALPPDIGAAMYAALRSGNALSDKAIDKLRNASTG